MLLLVLGISVPTEVCRTACARELPDPGEKSANALAERRHVFCFIQRFFEEEHRQDKIDQEHCRCEQVRRQVGVWIVLVSEGDLLGHEQATC